MKRLLLFLPLLIMAGATLAFGQNSAIPGFTMTVGPGNLTRAIPFAPLVICNYPATGGAPCTNFAATSTSPTAATSCPVATPAVIPTTTTCTGVSDRDGNFVFFAPAGTTIPIPYTYYFEYNNTWNGPYVVTASGGGGGGGGGSINLLTNGVANSVQTQLNLAQGSGVTLVNAGGTTTITAAGILGATSGGGLLQTGSTLGLLTSCSANQVLEFIASVWTCASVSTGTVSGTGTATDYPLWTGASTLANSNLSQVTGPPAGINYALGGGQSLQLDASDLTFNSSSAGSGGNVLIQNIYSPGAGNNAGGIKIIAAPTTGNACAGSAWLIGGSGGFAAGLATVEAEGACNNGFGAGAANLDLTAGSTAASNSGGNVSLTPGTGGFSNGFVVITRGGLVTQGTAASSFGGAVTVSGSLTVVGSCTGCSTFPPGTGIPQVVGGTAWGSTLSTTGSGNVVLSNSPSLVTPNLGTPSTLVLTNATGAPTWNQNTTGTAANLTGCTPSTAGSVCIWNGSAWTLFAGNTSGTASLQENASGVPSWGSGSATTFQVNGTPLISATTVNFLNSPATDGITLTFTNGSVGQVTLGFTGTLTNAGLANPATTVNSQTCTLGSTCTIPFQTNTVNNTSQAGINLKPSTVNAVGLTVTPTNTGTNIDTFEITGGSYSGNAAGLFGTPSITVNGITATTYNGGTLAGTFSGNPTLSGNPTFSGSPVFSALISAGVQCVQANTAGVLQVSGTGPCGSGGGSISGTQNYIAYFATSSTLGSVGSAVSGTIPVFQNGGAPIASSPSMVDSSTSPVTTTPYTIQCDSATTILDRAHIVRLGTGSSVVTVPLSSGSGCAGLVTVLRNDSATAVTVNKTSTDTLTIFNGSANLDAQTTYQLGSGQSATLSQSQTGVWEIATPQGGTLTGITTAGGSGLTGGGTSGTLSLSVAAGGVTNTMLAGSIALTHLATQGANTLIANFTGSTASPVAYAMLTCSGNNDGEIYTSSTGLQCGTNFGQLNVASTWTANQTLTGHLIVTGHDVAIPQTCADTSGSGTVQVCNTGVTFTPVAGDAIIYTTTTANTGSSLTVNVNSLGAKSVAKWQNVTTIAANDLRANTQVRLTYDGTNWELDTVGNSPAGSGTVTVVASGSLTSTALVTGGGSQTLQTPSASSTLSSGGNMSLAGTIAATLGTLSGAGAASTSGLILTGSAYTAGSATTNFPQLYLDSGASGPSTFSGNGTQFGINPVSGFTGNLADFHAPNGGASVWTVNYQGLTAITPNAVVGGTVAYLTITGVASETDTAALLFVNTGTSSTQRPVDFQIQGVDQFQLCEQTGPQGEAVFGDAVACGSIYTTTYAKNVFMSQTASHTLIRGWQSNNAATGDMLQMNNATAAGTGFNFFTAYAGVTGADTFHTGGTLVFSVNGEGDLSGNRGTFSGAGAASTPGLTITGAPYTAGSTTTNFPQLYLNSGTGPSTFSANGTEFGINAPSGFTGNLLDAHINGGASIFSVASTGILSIGAVGAANNGAITYYGLTSGSDTIGCTNATCTQFGGNYVANFSKYTTNGNCAGVGTSANPSVVSCAAAASGAISCAVAASGGTCTVNTTQVTANSVITVTQVSDESTRLGVTCNATILALTAPLVSAKSTGTSFTITLPAFTTNPPCFDYVVND